VVRDESPKLLVNANVPLPPTVFFTTWIDPGTGIRVLVKVHVVVAALATIMAAGVPLLQTALVCVQPEGTVSLTL
jgi:hypothetical protein